MPLFVTSWRSSAGCAVHQWLLEPKRSQGPDFRRCPIAPFASCRWGSGAARFLPRPGLARRASWCWTSRSKQWTGRSGVRSWPGWTACWRPTPRLSSPRTSWNRLPPLQYEQSPFATAVPDDRTAPSRCRPAARAARIAQPPMTPTAASSNRIVPSRCASARDELLVLAVTSLRVRVRSTLAWAARA
jgi:hypothetical protein